MNNCPIGVFDSGVGGLSVFSELIKLLPDEQYIYFGDTKNLPYGNKTKEQLIEITTGIFDFFESKRVKAVVMACNTTSALTYDYLKNKYNFKIYPIVQSVSKQIAMENYSSIGVFATNATIHSHAYKKEISYYNPDVNIFETACPKWVNIVENRLFEDEESISNIKQLVEEMLLNNPNKIILGCTHYPYLLNVLSRFAPENIFINPAKCFAEFILKDLNNNHLLNTSGVKIQPEFYVSSNPAQFISSSKLFYKVDKIKEICLQKILCNKT
ncbi:MAG: glutamate racemase [Candidatus Gastranaerophilales bacterium]|nr:glutamate racemase [Candidatus Gastranaerophilales bacterium]